MSEARTRRRRHEGADRGLTLPELLITIVIIGIVGAVVTAGVSVTLRQHEATRGRVDVARWEQNLGMWLPDDLSSAAMLYDDAGYAPCAGSCGGVDPTAGSNVLGMSWDDAGSTTSVSYRFMPDGTGGAYGLFRVACTNGSCSSARVLGDLSAPDAGWSPGDPAPSSVIDVDASLSNVTDDDGLTYAIGRRSLSVTVNGIPALDGVVRSSRVNVAAGGAELSTLEPAQYEGPSFVQARSDCGGPITLIVDHSGSIGDQMWRVNEGVVEFIELLEGTPTRLQIVPFSTAASVLDPYGAGTWNVYLDLSEPGVADDLITEVNKLRATSLTNWEDALYRAFYTSNGTSHAAANNPAAPMPELVVFFTDGVPTWDRLRNGAADTLPTAPPAAYSATNTTTSQTHFYFSPRGWWRANEIAVRGNGGDAVRLLGVGVGGAFGQSTDIPNWWNPRWASDPVANQKLLGDLIVGGSPATSTNSTYNLVQSNADGTWPDVSAADVLVAPNFTYFKSALQRIALGECGGTLTVQTRLGDGTTAPFNVTYETEGEQVTTSRVAKSGTFDIDLAGGIDKSITLLVDQADLTAAGYTAERWECMLAGDDFAPALVEPGNPAAGTELTISANGAVACTLIVAK
jgi:prepilin-type N-terminal cleavage/methylation domain-containing protein